MWGGETGKELLNLMNGGIDIKPAAMQTLLDHLAQRMLLECLLFFRDPLRIILYGMLIFSGLEIAPSGE